MHSWDQSVDNSLFEPQKYIVYGIMSLNAEFDIVIIIIITIILERANATSMFALNGLA